jgi:hypothetical protein
MSKLSEAQEKTYNEIKNAPEASFDCFTYKSNRTYSDDFNSRTKGFVYGHFHERTLKSLEKKGLIKVHIFGGPHGSAARDEIEII